MALSTETGGVNFAVTTPNLSQYTSLATLKPLSFAGGMQSPIDIKPLAAWQPVSSKPELIAQGLTNATNTISQGIVAEYKSQRDLDREKAKDTLKFKRDKELARIKASADDDYRNRTLEEHKRHNIAMEEEKEDRIEKVGGNKLSTGSLRGNQEARKTNAAEPDATTEPVRFFGRDAETNYLKSTEPVKTEPKKLGSNAVDQQSQIFADIGNFGNLFSPTRISYVSANSLTDGSIADVPSAVHSTPTNPANDPTQVVGFDKETREPLTLGQLSATTFGDITPVLNSFESGTADGIYGYQTPANQPVLSDVKPVDSKAMEDAIGFDMIYPNAQEAFEVRDYAIKKGIMPKLASRKNGVEVTWPDDVMKKYREGLGGKQGSEKKIEEVFKEEKDLRGEFLDGAKNFKVVQSAWNNLKGKLNNPTGATDMSLIFSFMKQLDPTSAVRETEYANAANVGTIPQTLWGKYNKAIDGRGFLDPKVRQAFINEARDMYQSSLKGHKQSRDVYTKLAKRNDLNPENVVLDIIENDQVDQEKEEMEALDKELRASPDKDRKSPEWQSKWKRYIDLKEKLGSDNKKASMLKTQNSPSAGTEPVFSSSTPPPFRLPVF
jgi:hypothetical protein